MVWLMAASAVALGMLALSLAIGPISLPFSEVVAVVVDRLPMVSIDHDVDPVTAAIITDVRFPRVVLAGLVGAVLATAGGAYQATFRNPLADPYLLGAAGGAGLGVTVALTETGGRLGSSNIGVTMAAFAGAVIAVWLAYVLGRDGDGRSGPSLILAGVAVAALCAALQTLLLQRDDEALRDVYAWLLGRLNVAGWDEVRLLAPSALVALGSIIVAARRLDLLALGDDEAEALGVHASRLRLSVIGAATLGTAAAVAVSGLIGFVGIVVPHAVRLRVGPSYRRILPLAAILGVPFLSGADLLARSLLAPGELPIGVLTAAVGAPFFLLLLRTNQVRAT
jgi:iron complex transport system permease protein